MRMIPAILIMSMSKPPPHLGVKKLLRRLLMSQVWKILWKRALLNSNLIWTLTWFVSKLMPYSIPLLRYDLRMGKPMIYHSLTHFHQQLRRKRKRSIWSLLST
jgi:hypothetical protein